MFFDLSFFGHHKGLFPELVWIKWGCGHERHIFILLWRRETGQLESMMWICIMPELFIQDTFSILTFCKCRGRGMLKFVVFTILKKVFFQNQTVRVGWIVGSEGKKYLRQRNLKIFHQQNLSEMTNASSARSGTTPDMPLICDRWTCDSKP